MEIQQLPIASVFPSPMNPRKTFSDEDLSELADNIEKQGLLQPITVRPKKVDIAFDAQKNAPVTIEDGYEIVCGERRYRAFRMLSEKWSDMDLVAPKGTTFNRYSHISAIVREMDDEEAFDAMITENLQRKDVDPIEEAFAFGQLAKTGKTAEEIAARFGKSIRFVTERIKLNTLIPELMLAVKEDRMPISAAQILCKLDPEDQKKFLGRNINSGSYTKWQAENFTQNLFMEIDRAVWNGSEDFSDHDYSGGCGVKCSECQFNTVNHGCLFYEMKSNGSGRCTDRNRFNLKSRSFILDKVTELSANLVKKGAPLEYGKTVLAVEFGSYETEEFKNSKKSVLDTLTEQGYEVVDPEKVFKSKCWYKPDDERTIAMTSTGELYRVLSLFSYRGPKIQEEYWYVKNFNKSQDGEEAEKQVGVPVEVSEILARLREKQATIKASLHVAGTKALDDCVPINVPMTADERVLMLTCMLVNNSRLCKKVGIPDCHYADKIRDHVASHPEIHHQVMHAWLHERINLADPCRLMAAPVLDDLGKLHCPEEYRKSLDKVQKKHDKEVEKMTKRLAELGYDTEGNLLPPANDEPEQGKPEILKLPIGADLMKQFKEMKKKHPDAILLFRVGDFYECFHEDADKVAEVLSLTVIKNKNGKLAGFPHHAFDAYLPKLVRAGVRVVVCEQLEDPKQKKKK